MNRELQEKIQAWVDGELDPAEARNVGEIAGQDPAAAALAGNLRNFRQLVRDHEPARTVPESREFYWSKIRRGIEAANRIAQPTPRKPVSAAGWLGWLIPAFGVALAVFLALRPGSLPSPSHPDAKRAQAMVEHVVEAPLPDINTITFYASRDAMTVVWVGRVDML